MNKNEQKGLEGSGANSAPEQNQQKGHLLDRYTVAPESSAGQQDQQSPYYKSQAPTIELPKGGGALKGIDEKFTVNAVNGTAALQVAMPASPGRGGFTPNLSLQYNSGSGNSVFGLGWALSLPAIQRKTDKKLPKYNFDDVFLMAGAEDLVPLLNSSGEIDVVNPEVNSVATPYHIRQYIPRVEGLFARIEFITEEGTANSWWRVTTKDNIVTYYGLTAAARIADPDDESIVFKWLPEISFDHKGNVQEYQYKEEDTVNVPGNANETKHKNGTSLFTNKYLKRVLYCNTTPYYFDDTNGYYEGDIYKPALPSELPTLGSPPNTDPPEYKMELVFDYGEHNADDPAPDDSGDWHCRKDPFSDFHPGFEVRTYRRCYRVLMYHSFSELTTGTGLSSVLVRSVDMAYLNGNTTAAVGEFAETDMITSFTSKGYKYDTVASEYVSKSLPPLTCDYQAVEWNRDINDVSKADAENVPQGLTGPYQWIDLDGEGLPGILTEQSGAWYYKHNLGDGHFAGNIEIAPKPSLAGLGAQLQWQDLDADGRRQLVSRSNTLPGYYELNDDQEWETFTPFREWPNINWESPYTKMLDLDGDGKPDVLLTEETATRWYENNGTEGYKIGGSAMRVHDEEKGPRILHSDMIQSIFLADINGDGLTDIVRVQNGEVCYWPNLGYGRFGVRVVMSNSPVFDRPEQFNPIYITLSDISGTGAADIMYLGQNECTAWLNQAGNAWSEPTVINPLPGIEEYSKIAVMDFLGNGTSCIVWSSPLPQHAHAPIRYIDLMDGKKPHLLASYSNSMGKTTTLTYKNSTKYYLEDRLNNKPWATKLPFPVHCLHKITTTDSISDTTYSQEYRYHHGYYDHEEREFRGFGRVDTIDTDIATIDNENELNQAPVLTKTWFHTGAFFREKTLIDKYETEYRNAANWNLPGIASYVDADNTVFTHGDMTVQEVREAHRAIKGSPLRQEVYAMNDEATEEATLYTITANSYIVKRIQQLGDNKFASFLLQQQENIVWHCEWDLAEDISGCDPRILHDLTISVDDKGNVLESAKVAYGRNSVPNDVPGTTEDIAHQTALDDAQGITKTIYTVNTYTTDVIDETFSLPMIHYSLRKLCDTQSFELYGIDESAGLVTPAGLKSDYDKIHHPGAILEFSETPASTGLQKRLLAHQRIVYLKDDISGPVRFGAHHALGLVYSQYQLALTDHLLNDTDHFDGKVTPAILADGKYLQENAIGSTITAFGSSTTNYWIAAGTMDYFADEKASFYTPEKFIDPWDNETTVTYAGSYYLLPETVTDALSANANITTVQSYDWRCLQPQKIKDPNDNITEILYDALCVPVAVAMNGKVNGSVEADELDTLDPHSTADLAAQANFWDDPHSYAADLLGHATWRTIYTYDEEGQPAAIAMIARELHYQYCVANAITSPLQIRITYTDGYGRVAMHKAQAADRVVDNPAPTDDDIYQRWISSGKTVYNNKGKVVMQYEPYFSESAANQAGGFEYDAAEQAANAGVSPRMHYDPLGRVVRTDMPDGSYSKTEWDAWQQTVYDNNDTVLDSDWYDTYSNSADAHDNDAAAKAEEHDSTPTIILLDVLAQPFYTVQHNRVEVRSVMADVYYQSYVKTDISGNRMAVQDARLSSGTYVLEYKYDMLQSVIKQVSADSGEQYMFTGADGQPVHAWQEGGREFSFTYDELRRPKKKILTISSTDSTLEEIIYGEEQTTYNKEDFNLRGQVYLNYDGAGTVMLNSYDFKGNPLNNIRQYTEDHDAHPDWSGTVDMEQDGSSNDITYIVETLVDAMNRPVSITNKTRIGSATPTVQGTTNYTYEATGMLYSVDVENVDTLNKAIVNKVHYNARGQRTEIQYQHQESGPSVTSTTKYTYDAATFRVTNIRTTRSNHTGTPQPAIQDLEYRYDPVGNVTFKRDNAQQTYFFANSVAKPENGYTYDALYRLVKATGRQHEAIDAQNTPNPSSAYDALYTGLAHTADETKLRNYIQSYTYDEVGNMTQMKHTVASQSNLNWTRDMDYVSSTSNLLMQSSAAGQMSFYDYDDRGNLIAGMAHILDMEYNALNRLEHTELQTGKHIYCQYDAAGQRVRKVVVMGNTVETRKYLGNIEVYVKTVSGTVDTERETLHVNDDTGRIAIIDTPLTSQNSEEQVVRYQFTDHLGTATMELDEKLAEIITYEEYFAFGSTSFQSVNTNRTLSMKRYRYTGKERDEETGLYYHGARYYAPWLARWCAVDPLQSEMPDWSSYCYGFNNPIMWTDPDGMQPGGGDRTQTIEIQDKDTLGKIAKRYGTTVDALMKANPSIENRNTIRAGDSLNVPIVGDDYVTPSKPPTDDMEDYIMYNGGVLKEVVVKGKRINKKLEAEYQKAKANYEHILKVAKQYGIILDETPKSSEPSTKQEYAQALLDSKSVTFGSEHPSPSAGYSKDDSANAIDNIRAAAEGNSAKTSPYSHVGETDVDLDLEMLKGLYQLSQEFSFSVTELSGAKHGANSRHYVGTAADIGYVNGQKVSASNPDYKAFLKRAKALGATEALGPGNKGHSGHIHIAWPRN